MGAGSKKKNLQVRAIICLARRMESTNDVEKKIKVERDQIWHLCIETTYLLHSHCKVSFPSDIKHFFRHTLNKIQRNGVCCRDNYFVATKFGKICCKTTESRYVEGRIQVLQASMSTEIKTVIKT